MFWGLSPALDLQEEYFLTSSDDINEINIIIIGGCDARHVIKTIAKAYKHKQKQINIHIIEGCSELVARQILLLYIATMSPDNTGLQEKTRMFMELYGNSLLRYSSSTQMVRASKNLINFVTNLPLMEQHWPLVSLEKIKYRERDYIEMLLKFWKEGYSNKFDICNLWDKRLRNYLGARYDSRFGVFDWDYNMRLRDVGGKTINIQEYKHFRSTGVAFTWLETEVTRPNNTLAAGVLIDGEKFIHRGYLGDIVTGPYVAHGLDCDDKELMKASNGTYHKRSTDLTERNLMRMFYEIENGKPFDAHKIEKDTDQNLGMVTLAMQDAIVSEELCEESSNTDSVPTFVNLDHIQVFFHSFSSLDNYSNNEKYINKFHILFVSNNLCKNIRPSIMKLMTHSGVVIIEGKKFVLDLKRDTIKLFAKDVEKIAEDWNCKLLQKYEPLIDSFVRLGFKTKQ